MPVAMSQPGDERRPALPMVGRKFEVTRRRVKIVMADEDALGLIFVGDFQVEDDSGIFGPFDGEIEAVGMVAAVDVELDFLAVRTELPRIGMGAFPLELDRAELLERAAAVECDLAFEVGEKLVFAAGAEVPAVGVGPDVIAGGDVELLAFGSA